VHNVTVHDIGPTSTLAQSDDIVGEDEVEIGEEMEVEDEEDEEPVTVPDSSDVLEEVSWGVGWQRAP
jgi:hypothetical protein